MNSSTAELLADAVRLHRQGALAEAAARYEQVLRNDPASAEALYALAQIACQEGRFCNGVELARRVLAIDPREGRADNLLGMARARLGRVEPGLASFEAAIFCALDGAAA